MFETYAGFGNNLYIDNIEISNAVGMFTKKSSTGDLFTIFPNPAHNTVNIGLFGNDSREVTIISLEGKTLLQRNIKPGIDNLDISHLSTGIYFIHVRNKRILATQKLIIE